MKVVRLSALRTGHLYPLGTHFSYRLSRPQGHSAAGRIILMKHSNDMIGNRTRDLPAYSAVPYPAALPHKSLENVYFTGLRYHPDIGQ